jgi:hypothetical protein
VFYEEEEEESEEIEDKSAADSWSDEEIDKTEMSENAVSCGRTVRTRRDGPICAIDFE